MNGKPRSAKTDTLQAEVDALKRLQAGTVAELDALHHHFGPIARRSHENVFFKQRQP